MQVSFTLCLALIQVYNKISLFDMQYNTIHWDHADTVVTRKSCSYNRKSASDNSKLTPTFFHTAPHANSYFGYMFSTILYS